MHLGLRKRSWICSLRNHQRLSLDAVYATTFGQELQIRVSANWAPDPTVFCIREKNVLDIFLVIPNDFEFPKSICTLVRTHTQTTVLFLQPLLLSIGLAERRAPCKPVF